MIFSFVSLVIAAASAKALPTLENRQAITPLSASEVDSFAPFSRFAAAAYCHPDTTLHWNCSPHCTNSPGFIPTAAGGDGDLVQYWYVGYAPALRTVIVAHQGTVPSNFDALMTDLNVTMEALHPSFFPNLPANIQVHRGFRNEHEKTAATILVNVQKTLASHNANSVTLVGHSLGAALALLDAVYLGLHLPSSVSVNTIVYGLPRAGNQAFADYVDAHVRLTHVNNKRDPIPIMPAPYMGYVHPSGEVHIEQSNQWVRCPGHDNPSPQCIVGAVRDIFSGNGKDHRGPYNGVSMICHGH